ncbi:Double-stranded RNA-specific editase Adar isoform X3 [Aphelenchoides fujianensis]|nr:Double-stranded RNA-specific editase Adar isoform X3 [Aphelenchoides fujianensis]
MSEGAGDAKEEENSVTEDLSTPTKESPAPSTSNLDQFGEFGRAFRELNPPPKDAEGVEDAAHLAALAAVQHAHRAGQTDGGEQKAAANAAMILLNHEFGGRMPRFFVFHLPVEPAVSLKFLACVLHNGDFVVGQQSASKAGAKQSAALALVHRLGLDAKLDAKLGSLKRQHDEAGDIQDITSEMTATFRVSDPSPQKAETLPYLEREGLSGMTKYFLTITPKNPVGLLNETLAKLSKAAATFEITQPTKGDFVATCFACDYEAVEGVACANKKAAKTSAARVMLDRMVVAGVIPVPAAVRLPAALPSPTEFREFVRNACYCALYAAIEHNGAAAVADTRMVGCVLVDSVKREATLVSWACGSYAGPTIFVTDHVLRDCDAAVLCKRGLQKFFYRELMIHASNPQASIFYAKSAESNVLTLRPSISLHFFLNYAPKVRTDVETQLLDTKEGRELKRFNKRARVPWSMSTVDKIMKWNFLGVQGAVLSAFVEPVYLTSFVLQGPINRAATEAAFWGRTPPMYPLKPGFSIHTPTIDSVESDLPQFDLGVPIYETPSSLSRSAFFRDLSGVHFAMGETTELAEYVDYKRNSRNYNEMYRLLKETLAVRQFGIWVQK